MPLLRELIDGEDKHNPLSDEQLSLLMREHGEPISRRTVAKYRDAMNIPVAALRRR
jgi:RNA polymerase sigma-54 factor